MEIKQKLALAEALLCLADDELILGHRASEWCGHAPILEEDIAFANLALDEIGHASIYYSIISELRAEDPQTYPDELVYFRTPGEYRCTQFVELPIGDWAFSMLRQYLFDCAESIRLEQLMSSSYLPLAEAAAKIRQEEIYHLRHTRAWTERLALGTAHSLERIQTALNTLWPYTDQIFSPLHGEADLSAYGFMPESKPLQLDWVNLVSEFLTSCGLQIPISAAQPRNREEHTDHLRTLLTEMQSVARLDSKAAW